MREENDKSPHTLRASSHFRINIYSIDASLPKPYSSHRSPRPSSYVQATQEAPEAHSTPSASMLLCKGQDGYSSPFGACQGRWQQGFVRKVNIMSYVIRCFHPPSLPPSLPVPLLAHHSMLMHVRAIIDPVLV